MLDKRAKISDTRRQSSILDFCIGSSPKQREADAGHPASGLCTTDSHHEPTSLSSDPAGTVECFLKEAAFSPKGAVHPLKGLSDVQDAELPESRPNDQVRYSWLKDIRDAAGRTTGQLPLLYICRGH